MPTATIEIEVDEETARRFAALSRGQQQKFSFLFGAHLLRMTQRPVRSITEVMDEMGAEAAANGMTPEILEEILNER